MVNSTSSIFEIQAESEKKLKRRLNALSKKYQNVPEKDIPLDIKKEIIAIQQIMGQMEQEIPQKDKWETATVKGSEKEEWYYNMMRMWANTHTDALNENSKTARATLYRFALHFFVEQIVLSPKNNALSYSMLKEHVKTMTDKRDRELVKVTRKLKDIENMVAYLGSITNADAETNPKFGTEFDAFVEKGLPTDNNPESSFAKNLNVFSEKRQKDFLDNRQLSDAERMGRER